MQLRCIRCHGWQLEVNRRCRQPPSHEHSLTDFHARQLATNSNCPRPPNRQQRQELFFADLHAKPLRSNRRSWKTVNFQVRGCLLPPCPQIQPGTLTLPALNLATLILRAVCTVQEIQQAERSHQMQHSTAGQPDTAETGSVMTRHCGSSSGAGRPLLRQVGDVEGWGHVHGVCDPLLHTPAPACKSYCR
jgi:hypothetical protein